MDEGRVEGIFVSESKGDLPHSVDTIRAVSGAGLVGNRYFYGDGDAPPGRALTLIAAESRRNVLTRGIDVNALVGKRFRVGGVECLGIELCEPCIDLERMTKPGVIKGMVHRAGLNADVLSDGEIAVGDAVAEV
jgi:MOSC domain-containing protein YiiM